LFDMQFRKKIRANEYTGLFNEWVEVYVNEYGDRRK
jgi:hypothetical protein